LVTAITFHQIFEGLSLGIRISSLPLRAECDGGFMNIPMLEQTLAFLFAITTPTGILIGLVSFGKGDEPGNHLSFPFLFFFSLC
jgi:solute carrier family 39 (zinc transporter), member 1/2/3